MGTPVLPFSSQSLSAHAKEHVVMIMPAKSEFTVEGRFYQHAYDQCLHRWKGLKRAFEKTSANVDARESIGYMYARDPVTLVGNLAFYPQPSTPLSYHRDTFLALIENLGYRGCKTANDAHMEYDGGNFIYDAHRKILLVGLTFNAKTTRADAYQHTMSTIAKEAGVKVVPIDMSHLHLDCALNILPNGQLLVKLCEEHSCEGQQSYGVTDEGLETLRSIYGDSNIITFSFSKHTLLLKRRGDHIKLPDHYLSDHSVEARSLSMLTNFEAVGRVIVGEKFPEALAKLIEAKGMTMITPSDVGLDTFLMGDSGFNGAARCASLKVQNCHPS